MEWIQQYQLFLLDLDGLLVNTEELHYQAYQAMCRQHGCILDLSFREYCAIAHTSNEGLEAMVYKQFPRLRQEEPRWSALYAEKKALYRELLYTGPVQMMPGAERFLCALQEAGVKRCVVTHSATDLVEVIRQKNPVLDSVPVWFTRESYTQAKPHPECYQKAVLALADAHDQVIGFEDTPRGLDALAGTRAKRVLICAKDHPCFPSRKHAEFLHFESFEDLPNGQKLA